MNKRSPLRFGIRGTEEYRKNRAVHLREYDLVHKERIAKYKKEYAHVNKDQIHMLQKRYRDNNQEKRKLKVLCDLCCCSVTKVNFDTMDV